MSNDDEVRPYATNTVVPTIWKGKDGQAVKSQSPVVHPDEMTDAERKLLTETVNTCGQCKFFSRAEGQKRMEAQRFVDRLVQEENWQTRHLVSPLNELGLCGQHESGRSAESMLTGTMHQACDAFRAARGHLSLVRKSTDDDA